MFLEKLSVLNFKNHAESRLDLNPNVNCFVGNNGSGKTNLLDAIHYLSFTKSFFIKQDSFNILYNQPFMSIEGTFDKDSAKDLIQCAVKSGSRRSLERTKRITISSLNILDYTLWLWFLQLIANFCLGEVM